MKIRTKLLTLLLGAAGLAAGFSPGASEAATINTSAALGSVVLGFREDGSSTAYLVNLGSFSQFVNATPGSVTALSLGSIGVDLIATFGGSWNTRTDLYWGVFGTSNTSNPNLYASKARTNVNTPGTPWPNLSGSLTDRQNTAGQIGNVFAWIDGKSSTANSNVGIVQSGVSGSASYYVQVATPSTTDFGATSQWTSIEGSFGNGTSGTVLDFFRVPNGNLNGGVPTNLGAFRINNSGGVTFTAVPEPSTYALLALTGTVFMVFVRRRKALQS
ncbi:MAG: PEP-CTERM sorting domain-containing protein [Verrucomicrobia bacterium]|nr:PEP-CTERM sorting domain-containing protein [Verrucomicrobiota bacterium]